MRDLEIEHATVHSKGTTRSTNSRGGRFKIETGTLQSSGHLRRNQQHTHGDFGSCRQNHGLDKTRGPNRQHQCSFRVFLWPQSGFILVQPLRRHRSTGASICDRRDFKSSAVDQWKGSQYSVAIMSTTTRQAASHPDRMHSEENQRLW